MSELNKSNKYIFKELNPSVSNLHEAPSAVHVQFFLKKASKLTNKKTKTSDIKKKPEMGG